MSRRILLVGNPNVGKSSLFNLLTGIRQKTGNYPGVTVEVKKGTYKKSQLIDLPGLKSIWPDSQDEKVSIQEVLTIDANNDSIIYVADGMNLEHDMLLFSQLADLQIPIILAINFKDELENALVSIDTIILQEKIGCRVVLLNSRSGDGIANLKKYIDDQQFLEPNTILRRQYDDSSEPIIQNDFKEIVESVNKGVNDNAASIIENDMINRNRYLHLYLEKIISHPKKEDFNTNTEKIDKVLLHPFWGNIIFILILFLIFQAIYTFSAIPMDWIDQSISWLSTFVGEKIQLGWLSNLLGKGIIPGLGGIVIFIPQIAILFLLMGIMESTGYMSRISYLSDRWLKRSGLSGSSVIPLMSGFACSIPAIMSARTIRSPRERLAAILVIPFMTCSARLPVYTILIALIFPEDSFLLIFNMKGLALLVMYLLGIVTSLVAAYIINRLRKSNFQDLWVLELPRYRMPHWRNIFIETWTKTKSFVLVAGRIILAFSIIIWLLSSISPKSEDFIKEQVSMSQTESEAGIRLQYSYAGYMGKVIEPVIKPLGYDWKIGIALLSSFAAREVFVGTIATIYSIGSEEESTIIKRLANEKDSMTGSKRYNLATCVSLLLFYAFAMQCMSTLAIVKKETGGWKWPAIQMFGMLALAYISSLIAYQTIILL